MSDGIYQAACAKAAVGMEIAAVAAEDPHRTAIVSDAATLSFAELNALANRIANLMRDAGIEPGDPVALVCANRAEFCAVAFAAHRVGARLTPVNWHLSAEEIAYVVDDCDATVLFADARLRDAAEQASKNITRLTRKVSIGGDITGFDTWELALEPYSDQDIERPSRGTIMQYTSGTTGRPKGVKRAQPDPEAAAGMQQMLTAVFQYQPDTGKDLSLVPGPLYHSGPFNLCMMTPLTAGIGCVIMDKWSPEATLQLIEKHQISHTFMVPTMFSRLLALPQSERDKFDVSSLRFIIHGAAPCPKAVKQRMFDWVGPIIWELFAGTEGPGTIVGPEEWLAKPGTVGKPGLGQTKILNENGEECAAGEEGQIWMVNPESSKFEYHKAPEKTQEAVRDGYFTAGDIGLIDEDGYLFITGRSAEVIISGGVNIYPQEIDDVLAKHPAVVDVACVGVPHADLGEQVKAVVALKPGKRVDAEELIEFCAPNLAKQKWPRSVDFVDEIPRSEAGKVYRRALRDSYWQNEGRRL